MEIIKVQLSREEIFYRVSDVLMEELQVGRKEITLESSLVNDLGITSIDRYKILMEIENEFNTAFNDEEIQTADIVKDIVDLISNKLN